ncbi:uncharacterized protein LOC128556500 [Mercenaria mercenaria]|uniref:uncharacterized protein LOC128556500 n=1 Tax=Mercenaria mercenaria TaxID=6596 RepID=UPI00234E8C0D|nr:uncharacterized protein LOC128556500 [Mercenaria mercenaria]
MVTTKHCCYGDCKSDSRTLNNDGIFFIGFGNGFPKPKTDREKCMRWVQNCGRKYFTIANVNKDTYICSLHFVGEKGPTEENPDPIKCGTEVTRKRKRPAERLPYKTPKQQRTERNEAAQAMMMLPMTDTISPVVSENAHEGFETVANNAPKTLFTSTGVNCKPDVQEKESQTEKTVSSDIVRLKIQNRILENNLKVSSQDQFQIQKPKKQNTVEEKARVTEAFSVDTYMNDDKAFKFYTGLTCIQFLCLWDFLGDCTQKINFWNSSVSNPDKTPSRRPGRKRLISPQNQLFMFLMRVRLGLLHQDLAYRFETNTRQVSTIIITWVQLLYKQFSMLKEFMFASRRKVRKHLPRCFKKYKNIRCIIDCTEVHVQSPGNFEAREISTLLIRDTLHISFLLQLHQMALYFM